LRCRQTIQECKFGGSWGFAAFAESEGWPVIVKVVLRSQTEIEINDHDIVVAGEELPWWMIESIEYRKADK
jgi:hypothetical protein